MPYLIKAIVLFWLLVGVSIADVVKPALVEISIYPDKKLKIVIDLSLEAVMSSIGTQYKKTTDAPNSAKYDILRSLAENNLRAQFKAFETEFLNHLLLTINETPQRLTLTSVKIDIVGYKKRPRKTLLTYSTQLSKWPKTLSWQYAKILKRALPVSAKYYQHMAIVHCVTKCISKVNIIGANGAGCVAVHQVA